MYLKDEDGDYTVAVRGNYNDIHPTAKFGKNVILSGWSYIGEGAKIGARSRIANWCNVDKEVEIGEDCNLQVYVVLSMGSKVGNRVFFAGHVSVADEKFPMAGPQIRKPTVFKDDSIIGMGALIIGGVTIGEGSVVGMGSVVVKDVPDGEVWIGNPARFKMLRSEYDAKKSIYEGKLVARIP